MSRTSLIIRICMVIAGIGGLFYGLISANTLSSYFVAPGLLLVIAAFLWRFVAVMLALGKRSQPPI